MEALDFFIQEKFEFTNRLSHMQKKITALNIPSKKETLKANRTTLDEYLQEEKSYAKQEKQLSREIDHLRKERDSNSEKLKKEDESQAKRLRAQTSLRSQLREIGDDIDSRRVRLR